MSWKKYLILSISLSLLASFSFATWETDTCVPINLDYTWCNVITMDKRSHKLYAKPFCYSSLWDSNENDYMKSCMMPILTNSLSVNSEGKSLESDSFYKSDLLERYCLSLLWEWKDWRMYFSKPRDPKLGKKDDDRDWQQTFDSHQSLFVYALCSSFDKDWERIFLTWDDLISDVFTWEVWDLIDIIWLQQMADWKNRCDLNIVDNKWNKNLALPDCDLSIFASKIYTAIMSDLFKIKYAQIFHVNTVEGFDENEEKRILDFFIWYFNSKDYDSLEALVKDYRQTVDVVKTNQEYFKNVLKTIKIIDNSNMVDLVEKSKCPLDKDMVLSDFVACALHASQWKRASLEPSFVTLIYNEMLHYRLFISYFNEWWNSHGSAYKTEAFNFNTYSSDQLQSTQETLRDLEDINMTYPLHIGLLLYQEKMKKYRDSYLSPIVTIFYSLSEKLQNVQLTE